MGVLVTYPAFVLMLLPWGYDLWVALAAATTACVMAGQVTRMVTLSSLDHGMAGAAASRSFIGRVAASWVRAVVTEMPSRGVQGRDDDAQDGAR
ncbi:hypothetical protein ABZ917_05795 [Nonomuraea wenchangensis]